jgi:hypothetical protein
MRRKTVMTWQSGHDNGGEDGTDTAVQFMQDSWFGHPSVMSLNHHGEKRRASAGNA